MILVYEDNKELIINSNTLFKIDLSNRILNKLYLNEENVSGANFKNSDLRFAFFYRSDFTQTDFTNANISYINGGRGIYKNTNFTNVIMNNANLEFSDLKMANFKNSELSNTNFANTYLWGANFENADLTNANFENAIVSFCNFNGANLTNACFKNVKHLHTTKLIDSILENTNLTNVGHFKEIDFSKCKKFHPFIENNINLNLLVLRCQNIEQSKKFYEKLQLIFIKEQHGSGLIHYSTCINNLVIELYPLGQYEIDNTRLGFSLTISTNLEKYLEEKRIDISSKYEWNNQVYFVVRDLDGRKVVLSNHCPVL